MKKLLMIRLLIIGVLSSFSYMSYGQSKDPLPLQTFNAADTSKPMIFYISGDGGMNKFSTTLLQSFNAKGYAVVALDARSYFWQKKDPKQAADDVNTTISQYINKWQKKHCIVIGYSFGADVLPFIFTRLSGTVQQKTVQLIFLSPSATTDFEVHITNMLGFGSKDGKSVPDEMNKINKPVLLVFGEHEDDFPLNRITVKSKQVLIMPGGHHYDKDTNDLCNRLLQKMR